MSLTISAAIISMVVLGVHNALVPLIIDKNFSKRSFILYKEFFATLFLFIAAIIMLLYEHRLPLFDWWGVACGLITGFLGYIVYELYYKALTIGKKGPVSAVAYSYMAPFVFISLFLAHQDIQLFGHYRLLQSQVYVGIGIITLGVIFLGLLGKDDAQKTNAKSILLAVGVMFVYALMILFLGPLQSLIGIYVGAFLGRIGIISTSVMMRKVRPQDFQKPHGWRWFHLAGLGFLTAVVMWAAVAAVGGEHKEIAAAIYGANPMVTWIVTLLFLDKDRKERDVNIWQVLGVLLVIGGIIMISLYK